MMVATKGGPGVVQFQYDISLIVSSIQAYRERSIHVKMEMASEGAVHASPQHL